MQRKRTMFTNEEVNMLLREQAKLLGVGYVYFFMAPGQTRLINNEECLEIKVGKTSQTLTERRGQLQTGNADELRLLFHITNATYTQIERYLHTKYKAVGKHIRGEWYALSESDLADIREIYHVNVADNE